MKGLGNPANRVKYSSYERQRVYKRIEELLKEGRYQKDIAEIMNYEGFRRPNGKEITPQFVCIKVKTIRNGDKRKKNAAGPVKETYRKKPAEQPQPVKQALDIEAIVSMCRYVEDDLALGKAIRSLVKSSMN